MKTTAPVLAILSIGMAAIMIQMSGLPAVWGGESATVNTPNTAAEQFNKTTGGLETSDKEDAKDVGPIQNALRNLFKGVGTFIQGTMIGVIINAALTLRKVVGSVAVLPVTLMRLGFPPFFALPVGAVGQFIAGIGVLQFLSGRRWR